MGGARQQKKGSGKKSGGGGSKPARQQGAGGGAASAEPLEPEPEPEPEPETGGAGASSDEAGAEGGQPQPEQADGSKQHFRAINRAFVRAEFEMNSTREGTIEVGEEIEALEMRHNENGVLRIRFDRGWVSCQGPDGSTILERTAAVSGRQLEARESLLTGKRPAGGAPVFATGGETEADEEQTNYRVLNRAFVRGSFELDSRRQGTVEPGEEIVALELRDNQDGVTRVRFERGWVSATGPDGTAVLAPVCAAEAPPQHGLLDAALTEGLLDADGRPKPLAAQAARAPKFSQYALLSADDDDGEPSSFDFHHAAAEAAAARGTWPTVPTFDGAPAPAAVAATIPTDEMGVSALGLDRQQPDSDGSGPPGSIVWEELLGELGGGHGRGLAGLGEAPRVSAAELLPDNAGAGPDAEVRSIGAAELEGLRLALEEQQASSGRGGGSRLEEYTHENPAYPNPLEFALCRRESPSVMRALCAAFPTSASELLAGPQQQLPLHAACVSGGHWLVPPSISFGASEDEDVTTEEKVDDSAAAVVAALLEAHPAAARCPDADGCFPLHLAARHSPSPKVVETLLAAHPTAASTPDKAGNLPLHLAFMRPLMKPAMAQTVSLLLGANPEGVYAMDGEGRTAAEIGKRKGAAKNDEFCI